MSEKEIEELRKELNDLREDVRQNFDRLDVFFRKFDQNVYNRNDLPLFRWSKKKW